MAGCPPNGRLICAKQALHPAAKRVFNCDEQIIEKFTINPFLASPNSLEVKKFISLDDPG